MKVAIMQPYFFPYLGYFSLIKNADQFILLDTVQFIRHGWIERNRILKQDDGWIYIKVPIIKAYGQKTLIKEVKIDNNQNWKHKIISQIQPYKKIAPYYHRVLNLLNNLFKEEFKDITHLNKTSLEMVCSLLAIEKKIDVFSEMDLKIKDPKAPDEWALNICKALHDVTEYWNPPGGIEIFDKLKYENSGIRLRFLECRLTEYDQKRKKFEPALSILDVLMFNSINDIQKMLNNFILK